MSWWPGSGRYSPFTSFYNRSAPPAVTEEDYSYLTGENEHSMRHNSYGFPHSSNSTSHHPSHYRHGSRGSHQMEPPTDIAPDQLILRHKGTTYPLHFTPFSISEGDLKVRELRRSAARELNVHDPRRVKLLYKGKQMRDDDASCKHENLKQNSEVMCVVSSEPSRTSSESDGSDSVGVGAADGPRDEDRKKKRKGHRGGGKKKVRHAEEATPAPPPQAGLAPPPDARPATSRTPSPSPKKPTTPAEMLADIEAHFDADLAPKVKDFMAHPPPDAKAREFEYKKLSEAILTQVLLKLDGVETLGDDALRAKRKALVKNVQAELTELDRVGKPK